MANAILFQTALAGFIDNSGNPLTGGTVTFFEIDGVTLKDVFLDGNKILTAANPFPLSSRGTAILFMDGEYNIVIKDALGVVIDTPDNVSFIDISSFIDVIPASSFGTAQDEVTIQAAIDSALGADRTVYLSTGDWDIGADLTIPTNINLRYEFGAFTTVAFGITLNILGVAEAPLFNIFRGTGTTTLSSRNNDIPSIWLVSAVQGNRTFDGLVTFQDDVTFTGTGTFLADLIVDTNTLFVDSADDFVGITTLDPKTKLHILDTGTPGTPAADANHYLVIQNTGVGASNTGLALYSGNTGVGSLNFGDTDSNERGAIKYLHTNDSLQLFTSDTLAMTISSSGSVGIGTPPTGANLIVGDGSGFPVAEPAADEGVFAQNGQSGISILSSNTANSTLAFGDTDDTDTGSIRYAHSNDQMAFFVNGNQEAMCISSVLHVGIGNNNPNSDLDVRGTQIASFSAGRKDDATAGQIIEWRMHATFEGNEGIAALFQGIIVDEFQATRKADLAILTQDAATLERMRIKFDGKVGIGTTSPDALLEVEETTTGTEILNLTQLGTGDSALQYKAGGTSWYSGIDNSDSDTFKIGNGALGTADRFALTTTGFAGFGTTTPDTLLQLSESTTNSSQLKITQLSTGDSAIQFDLAAQDWFLGVDNSDSDKFKIDIAALGTNSFFTIDTSGNVGIGTAAPANLLELFLNDTQPEILKLTQKGSTDCVMQFERGTSPNVQNWFMGIQEESVGDFIIAEDAFPTSTSSAPFRIKTNNNKIQMGGSSPFSNAQLIVRRSDGGAGGAVVLDVHNTALDEDCSILMTPFSADGWSLGVDESADKFKITQGAFGVTAGLSLDFTSPGPVFSCGLGEDSPTEALEIKRTGDTNLVLNTDTSDANTSALQFKEQGTLRGEIEYDHVTNVMTIQNNAFDMIKIKRNAGVATMDIQSFETILNSTTDPADVFSIDLPSSGDFVVLEINAGGLINITAGGGLDGNIAYNKVRINNDEGTIELTVFEDETPSLNINNSTLGTVVTFAVTRTQLTATDSTVNTIVQFFGKYGTIAAL